VDVDLDVDLDACLRTLRALAGDPARVAALDEARRRELRELSGRIAHPGPHDKRRLARAFRQKDRALARTHDERLLGATLNRIARRSSEVVLPGSTVEPGRIPAGHLPPGAAGGPAPGDELRRPRACYVCKAPYRRLHFFYDSLCPECAAFNFAKRTQGARLDGRVALVTGARIKIGYRIALMLLRSGADVIATTRFPFDAAERFAREPDYAEFAPRLRLYGLDLRDAPLVERFAAHLAETAPRLDFLVNNAAQTVRRPPAYYESLVERERAACAELPARTAPLLRAGMEWERAEGTRCRARSSRAPTRTSRAGAWTSTSSRSTCARSTAGASPPPTCPPSSCSRCTWSTPSPRSCSRAACGRCSRAAAPATATS